VTVAELRKVLLDYPPTGEIGWQDHDSEIDRINDRVRAVSDFDEADSFDMKFCENIVVVLRP